MATKDAVTLIVESLKRQVRAESLSSSKKKIEVFISTENR